MIASLTTRRKARRGLTTIQDSDCGVAPESGRPPRRGDFRDPVRLTVSFADHCVLGREVSPGVRRKYSAIAVDMARGSLVMKSPKCPKCSGVMERGFVVEYSDAGANSDIWAEGEPPQGSFFNPFPSVRGRRVFPVTTHRCTVCGYLESYATQARRE